MNSDIAVKKGLKGKMPVKRIIILIGVLVLLVAASVLGYRYIKAKAVKSAVKQQLSTVEKGDISVTVSGSGPIHSANKYDITSNVNGKITGLNYKDGDKAKNGDILIEIDDQEAQLKVKQLENSIAQAKLNQDYNKRYLNNNVIIAPISGEITDLQAKAGDTLGKNSVVLTITDKSKLKILATFNNSQRKKLHTGQEVTVNAFDTTTNDLYTVKGSITSIGAPSFTTNAGAESYNVEAVISNSGKLNEGMVGNIECNIAGTTVKSEGNAALRYVNVTTIKTETGGTVEKVDVEAGQMVAKGKTLVELENDDLVLTSNTDDLKLQDLEIQLETAKQQLEYYKIASPIDGTITLTDIKQGNSIKAGESLGSVANYDTMEFEIPIDELDIAKVQIGQTASVTIDALPDTETKPLKGTVSKIAVEGTSTNGVTTYPVTIQLEANSALKGGMNANAEILISGKTDILYLPLQAVQKRGNRSFVMVKSAGGTKQNGTQEAFNNTNANNAGSSSNSSNSGNGNNNSNRNSNRSSRNSNRNGGAAGGFNLSPELMKYYENAVMKPVKTGISNDEYIEIASGLKEGEQVILPPTFNNQSSTQQRNNGFGGGGAVRIPMNGGAGANNGGGANGGRN